MQPVLLPAKFTTFEFTYMFATHNFQFDTYLIWVYY